MSRHLPCKSYGHAFNRPALGRVLASLDFRLLAFLLLALGLLACPADRRPEADTEPPVEQGTEATEGFKETLGDAEAPEDAKPGSSDHADVAASSDEQDSPEESAEADAQKDDDYFGPPRVTPKELVPGEGNLYGVLRTNHGAMLVRFFEEEAPVAVANFVGLATGQVSYRHHETNEIEKGRFYDGTIFHRVIPEFMIQGGDPTGTGRGGPGYRFDCERQDLGFDRPGLLGMANAGRNTNGSQFFITEKPVTHLSGNHTIFGTLVEGEEVVRAIARVPRGRMDRPNEPVVLEKVEIIRSKEEPSR